MLKIGKVQSSEGGITHVINLSDPEAFKAAKKVQFLLNLI